MNTFFHKPAVKVSLIIIIVALVGLGVYFYTSKGQDRAVSSPTQKNVDQTDTTSATPQKESLALISPRGGETFLSGKTVTITWDPGFSPPDNVVSVQLLTADAKNNIGCSYQDTTIDCRGYVILNDVPNTGSAEWRVGTTFDETSVPSGNYYVRILYSEIGMSYANVIRSSGYATENISDGIITVIDPKSQQNSWRDYPVISSPQINDMYFLGDQIDVRWNPELVDVSTMDIVPADAMGYGGIQIYSRQSLTDPTGTGHFAYTIPNNLVLYPGYYQIKLQSYGAKNVFLSDVFEIQSRTPLLQRLDKPFFIKNVTGIEDSYKIGDIINLDVETLNGDDTPADTDKSFSVSGILINSGNNNTAARVAYDPIAKLWHLQFPALKKGDYQIQVQLYCGLLRIDSICGQEYGYDRRDEKSFNFSVTP